jgi:predicted negative regulator of RcsB-dependent stress response
MIFIYSEEVMAQKQQETEIPSDIAIDPKWSFLLNRQFIIIVSVILIGSVVGVGVWSSVKNQQKEEQAQRYMTFIDNSLEKFKKGEIKSDEFIQASKDYLAQQDNPNRFILSLPEVYKKLEENNETDKMVELYAAVTKNNTNSSSFLSYMLRIYYAFALEDQDKKDEAIQILEKNKKSKFNFMENILYFHLGRLYLAKGEKESATTNFTTVIEKYPDSEEAKMAEIYLTEMKI